MLDSFLAKTPNGIRAEMLGMPEQTIDAMLQFHAEPSMANLRAILPGMISWHLSPNAKSLPSPLEPGHKLREHLGLDSLALAEMAFKLDELLEVPIETHEVSEVSTIADLEAFLSKKLELPTE